MNLKILKSLTVILFLLITFDSGHIGGQFGLFIILGVMSGGFGTIASIITVLVLFVFLRSSFISSNNDFYIFLIGGIVLLVPIIAHIGFLISKTKDNIDVMFLVSTSLFLTFFGLTLFGTYRKMKKNCLIH